MVYGLNFIRDARIKGEKYENLILVEGYMDVIALGAAGINNAIAGMGTALTDGQIAEIKKNTQMVYVCYDGDEAGIKATNKNAPMLEKAGLEIKIVCLPSGMDPDEVIKSEGVEGFNKYLSEGRTLIEYRLKRCEDTSDLTTNEGRSKYLKSAVVALSYLESETDLDIYANIVSQIGQVSKKSVEAEVNKYKSKNKNNYEEVEEVETKPSEVTDKAKMAKLKQMRFVISKMLNNAKYVNRELIKEEWFTDPTAQAVVRWIKSKGNEDIIIGDMYAEVAPTEEMNAYLNEKQDFNSDIVEEEYYRDCLDHLVTDFIKTKRQELREQLKQTKEQNQRRQIMQELNELSKKLTAKDLESKII